MSSRAHHVIESGPLTPAAGGGGFRRVAPFMAVGMVAALSMFVGMDPSDRAAALLAVALLFALILATMTLPWRRFTPIISLLPVLAFLPIIALMRDITGQADSPYVALVFLPIFWTILYGTALELWLVIAGVMLTLGIPPIVSDAYPLTELVRMALLCSMGLGTGLSIQKSLRSRTASQARLARIIETAHDAYISISEDGLVRDWNGHATRLFGYERSEALGRSLTELIIPPELAAAHDAGMKRFMNTGKGRVLDRRMELPARTREGGALTVEITITALQEPGAWTFHAFLHDITARKASERALARAQMIVDNSDEAIYSYAVDGTIETWNAAACRLYGYTPEEAIGRYIGDLIFPDDGSATPAQLLEALRAGQELDHIEVQRRHKDGTLIEVELTVSPMLSDNGEVSGFSAIARDIGERLQVRQALETANADLKALNESKDQFVAMASHELRTPLTSVLGFAKTLRELDGSIDEEQRAEFLRIIEEQSVRLQRMIEDLLTLTNVESGKLRKNVELVQAAEIVRQVSDELQVQQLIVTGDEDVEVCVDTHHLKQILTNLLTNAVRYGRDPITVHVSGDDDTARIVVEDSGEGVPAEFVPKLFDRFSQVGKVTGGTGLGLAIVKSLIESYGGTIDYTGTHGTGARFEVCLPTQDSDDSDCAPD